MKQIAAGALALFAVLALAQVTGAGGPQVRHIHADHYSGLTQTWAFINSDNQGTVSVTTASAGDTIEWDSHASSHTVVSGLFSESDCGGLATPPVCVEQTLSNVPLNLNTFRSPQVLAPGSTPFRWPVPADAAVGTMFPYYCDLELHRFNGMHGVIVVTA